MTKITVWDDDAKKLAQVAEAEDMPVRTVIEEMIELYWDDYTKYRGVKR